MGWADAFMLLVVSHIVGDYLVQTDWQATHKRGGLGRNRVARRALIVHAASYTAAFTPALIWIAGDPGTGVLLAAAIGLPHLVQDDGRVVDWWMRRVKGADVGAQPLVAAAVDQAMHIVALLATALAAGT